MQRNWDAKPEAARMNLFRGRNFEFRVTAQRAPHGPAPSLPSRAQGPGAASWLRKPAVSARRYIVARPICV